MKTTKMTAQQLREAAEAIYSKYNTFEKLEILEACSTIANKMNLDISDLKLHESFLISYNVQKSILKSLEEINNTREAYKNH